jgi:hypothetical protein
MRAILGSALSPLAHGSYLTDWYAAFLVAWNYEHKPENPLALAEDFPEFLRAMCSSRKSLSAFPSKLADFLAGDPDAGFRIFVATIGSLLQAWRKGLPSNSRLGSPAAHWCDEHPAILEVIQDAMRSRSRCIQPRGGDWTPYECRPGGPAHARGNKKLVLVIEERFIGQRSWSQAAQTAAYALFGDFLAGEPEKIGFCRRCDRPFVRGKKTLFCSLKCARANSSIRSRDQRNAIKRLRGLRKAVKILDEWLKKSHRAGSDWRLKTEKAFGLRETGNRHSRLMGEYIRASETPPGSPQREKLLRSLLSGGTIDPAQQINVQQQLDGFLENISKANRRG